MMIDSGAVHVVFGGQAGSEAKGKTAGWFAMQGDYDVAVANFMPNAGHTWIGNDGHKIMVQTFPQSAITHSQAEKPMKLYLSAGQAIELKLLVKEVKDFDLDLKHIVIDRRAVIVQDLHKEKEAKTMGRISSTLKGCGEALADKAKRTKDTVLWGDLADQEVFDRVTEGFSAEDKDIIADIKCGVVSSRLNDHRLNGDSILIEAPQGYDLDINHGVQYPYCTSRQTTPAQALADAGLPPQSVTRITSVIRPYPIRVGNNVVDGITVGTSGDYPAEEITWEEVAERSGMPRSEITEFTTVTGKLRRVFELNMDRLRHMVRTTGTTDIALNFANYIDYEVQGVTKVSGLSDKVITFINNIEIATGVPVLYIGTGPRDGDVVDLSDDAERYKFERRVTRLAYDTRVSYPSIDQWLEENSK